MIRTLLAGTKTQTRRVLRDQQPVDLGAAKHGVHLNRREVRDHGKVVGHRMVPVHCPYGEPGGKLWVRETWRVFGGREYEYQQEQRAVIYRESADVVDFVQGEWRPSIFMPRWASRITLEITDVRCERVQSITEADAIAEGTRCWVCDGPIDGTSENDCACFHSRGAAVPSYQMLWKSINGEKSWDANPWVWVLEFRKVV